MKTEYSKLLIEDGYAWRLVMGGEWDGALQCCALDDQPEHEDNWVDVDFLSIDEELVAPCREIALRIHEIETGERR